MDLQTTHAAIAAIAAIADDVPPSAKPYFVALLGAAENFEIPMYVRCALIAAAGVQYREDALLRAIATIAFGPPACSDYESGIGAFWRTVRTAPREPRRAAVGGARRARRSAGMRAIPAANDQLTRPRPPPAETMRPVRISRGPWTATRAHGGEEARLTRVSKIC